MIQADPVRVVDEDMKDVPRDGRTMGELVMRGNNVMLGHFDDEEATARAFRGGWPHPGDLGIPHSDGHIELRDRAKAFVILKPGASVSEGELVAHVQTQLARFKAPTAIEFADQLPRTSTGKTQKLERGEKEWAGHSSRIQG